LRASRASVGAIPSGLESHFACADQDAEEALTEELGADDGYEPRFDVTCRRWYSIGMRSNANGMRSNAKSSITLPASEVRAVEKLQRRLGAPTKVAVVRRALRLLEETTDREQLRQGYREASLRTRAINSAELAELDHLAGEGLDE
jgi:hypothetical protein